MALIELRDVTRSYRCGGEEIRALDAVCLSVQRGEFVAVTGASGSGKTTLANVIGGLDSPTRGAVVVAGHDLTRAGDRELSTFRNAQVGFVYQTFNLLAHLSALENVMLPMQLAGMPRRVRRRKAADLLVAVGLADRTTHRPGELSGGQRQRVAIARALSCDPAIVIADEPTGNLDSARGAEIVQLLDGLSQRGVTLLVITHDAGVAGRARRVLRLRDGHLSGEGAPSPPTGLGRQQDVLPSQRGGHDVEAHRAGR